MHASLRSLMTNARGATTTTKSNPGAAPQPPHRPLHLPGGYAGRRLGALGQPPRTLLLHGFTGTAADWSDWPYPEPALALDLPGHGDSADPTGDFTDECRRLLAALPASIDGLIGYSLGGRLALGLLAAAPARFTRVTVLSAHPGLTTADGRAARRASDAGWIELLERRGIAAFVAAWEAQPLFATEAGAPPLARARRRATRLAARPAGLAASLHAVGLAGMPDLRDALTRWPGRLGWITGGLDARFTALGDEVARRRPTTRRHTLAGVGHNLLLEAPARVWPLLAPGRTPTADG